MNLTAMNNKALQAEYTKYNVLSRIMMAMKPKMNRTQTKTNKAPAQDVKSY